MQTTGQFISFILGNERYGINVILIKEVLEVPHIIKVPKMPDFYSRGDQFKRQCYPCH